MRDYGRVFSSFWQSPEARAFSEDGRTLALYLLTSPHANLIGCYRLSDAYAADDLQWTCERVAQGFVELSAKGFVSRDEATKWVFVHKYLKWNGFENHNVAIAASRAFDQVPSIPLKAALAKALLEFGAHLKEGFAKALQTLVESFANPEPEPIRNLNHSLNLSGAKPEPGCDAASAPPPAPPKKQARVAKPKKEPSAGVEVWNSYAGEYEAVYGVEPMRNAKVNTMLSNLCDRIPAVEAPEVARFYVRSKNGFYVSRGHPVDLLLKDAEKLRTEWFTGKQMTLGQARQIDNTQTNGNAFAGLLAEAERREQDHG